ncbi:MAG: IS3 family transposase [Bacilli bacterium]|nr:IS3 family transposase [Bacilli bacterium]
MYPIKIICRVTKLNRSTYYKVKHHKVSKREKRMRELEIKIIDIYNKFDSIYGAPKIRKELAKEDIRVSLKLVSRYMKRLG